MPIEVVDLFCGIGGLTRGLLNVGLNVKAGFDNDQTCEYAYTINNNAVYELKDIRETKAEDILKHYSKGGIKVLVGCAPCQPFSTMRKKLGADKNESDEKYNLLLEFGKLIEKVQPEIVSMENVPAIRNTSIFTQFLNTLKKNGYFVDHKVVYCPDYGIAQNRRRYVLLASKLGEIKIIPPTHNKKEVCIKQYIHGLPIVGAGEKCESDPMHKTAVLADINLRRIKASRPSGSWKDWPEELLPNCYKKESGQTFTSVYGRMDWNKIGPTMTTQFYCYGTGRFGHPEQDRALTLREGSLLQTFPREYKFIDPRKDFSIKDIARHIGNAVPVRLGEIIGQSILRHLN